MPKGSDFFSKRLYFLREKCSRKLRKLQIASCGTKKAAGNKSQRPMFNVQWSMFNGCSFTLPQVV